MNALTRTLSVSLLLSSACPAAALTLDPAFQSVPFATVTNDLGFETMIGRYTPSGDLLVSTRDAIVSSAVHNILLVDPSGTDTVLSDSTIYSWNPRYFRDAITDPADPNRMFLVDCGQILSHNGADGRLAALDLTTGALSTIIQAPFVDPFQVDVDPVTGGLLIADEGNNLDPQDGAVYRWDGASLTTELGGIDAWGVLALADGTYLVSGTTSLGDGIYHMSGTTLLGTFAATIPPGWLLWHDGASGMPEGLYHCDGLVLQWLPDADGDMVADSINPIVTAGLNSAKFILDPAGRLLATGGGVLEAILPAAATGAGLTPRGDIPLRVYPNPFVSRTSIEFAPRGESVHVRIHDVQGRLVRDLSAPDGPAGLQRAAWDGTTDRGGTAPAGIYFVRVQTGPEVRTKKIVRLRD